MSGTQTDTYPVLRPVGLTGLLVTFADRPDPAPNRAAIAFRAAIEAEDLAGVTETASTLTSTFVGFDPSRVTADDLSARLRDLLERRDWMAADWPEGRSLWTIPACFEGEHAPELDEAAELAGRSRAEAIEEICAEPLQALALGFAPGQAYLGRLPAHWDLARRTDLTPKVPMGAVVTAVRQVIVFATTAPTGWRRIGQTAFHPFRPDGTPPIPLAPGDEVQLRPVGIARFEDLAGPEGGATREAIE